MNTFPTTSASHFELLCQASNLPVIKIEELESYNVTPLYQQPRYRRRYHMPTWRGPPQPYPMNIATDPRLSQYPFNTTNVTYPNDSTSDFDTNGFLPYALTGQEQQYASPTSQTRNSAAVSRNSVRKNGAAQGSQSESLQAVQSRVRTQQNGLIQQQSPATATSSPRRKDTPRGNGLVFKNSSSSYPHGAAVPGAAADDETLFAPLDKPSMSSQTRNFFKEPQSYDDADLADQQPTQDSANPFSDTFPLVTDPPNLDIWRERLFNVDRPLHLTEGQYLTYFPHVDNVYSHRSTQKYKRKPFVSHYWDCRLKGRPSGTKKSDDPNKKKRKREKRERDLCDVKIKITEWFGAEERQRLGLDDLSLDDEEGGARNGDEGLQVIMEGREQEGNFGMLEPSKRFPTGHPGADGKRWYTIQRVNGTANSNNPYANDDDDQNQDLDHKHGLDESDRIKKNTVQRYLIKQDKGNKQNKKKSDNATPAPYPNLMYYASGLAAQTTKLHKSPTNTHLTFFGNSFCPFAQRVWIALELKSIPYQYIEVVPDHVLTPTSPTSHPPSTKPEALLSVCPDGIIPCIKHGNWGIWESGIMMEYLEDLTIGVPLLPVGNPQLRAHCRLWVDHVNRKILPAFYALLLTPPPSSPPSMTHNTNNNINNETDDTSIVDRHTLLVTTLQSQITSLVNASHAIGPFFLGSAISYVDIAFAPWIIRLSRVLSYYRNFPRPEVGTRWMSWVEAVEGEERVRRTVSSEEGYHGVYGGVGEEGWGDGVGKGMFCDGEGVWGKGRRKAFMEIAYAKKVIATEGFGGGGDVWGRMGIEE